MAPTLVRRRELTLLLTLQIAHLILISAQVPLHGEKTVLEKVLFSALSPFQRAASAVISGTSRAYHGYIGLRHASDENRVLQERLDAAMLELNRLNGERVELDRMHRLLALRESLPYITEAATVIGADSLNPMKTLFIDKGLDAGIHHNCPVISPEGYLVGRVVAPVASGEATVQLLTDSEANVGAILESSRTYAVISGTGDGRCILRFLPSIVDVARQEEVRTSGLDQIYPRGIPIGHVISSSSGGSVFKDVVVQPSVHLAQLESVLVLKGDRSTGARPSPEEP